MSRRVFALFLALCCASWRPAPASACGGFFCSSSPVDQNAERILFSVDDVAGTTDMIVQIAYQGADDAFAWLLPVATVPQNREVFPSLALSSFDGQSSPVFQPPPECQRIAYASAGGGPNLNSGADNADSSAHGVTVFVMETVGPYDVAVIQSDSSDETFQWLLSNGYRLSSVMKPYIELYTQQKMLFLAIKLTANATTKDIKPFKMTLPGTTPSIPLRLTAIAAEPEMGVVVWILGQHRYEPANADELVIPKEELRWRGYGFPVETNWTQLVAKHVDALGGRGWAVEQAGSTSALLQSVSNTSINTQDQHTAQQALLKLLAGRPYMTRLYSRVSAEEMGYDPSFRRSDKPDVPRIHDLPYIEEICSRDAGLMPPGHPCDFAACGSLGLCAEAIDPHTSSLTGACACAPGTSARTVFDAQGSVTVTCQDQRMSFMNPGETDEAGAQFTDPCVGYSCGDHGKCISMNLTPTCACDEGYVAVGSLDNAKRQTTCVMPSAQIAKSFYNRRPPALSDGMIAGRLVTLAAPMAAPDVAMPTRYGDPAPLTPVVSDPVESKHDGCRAAAGGSACSAGMLLALAWLARRRRRA